MKVKQKSNKPFWSMEVVCSGKGNASRNGEKGVVPCGSTLEVDLTDIFVEQYTSYEETDRYFTIRCCECGSLTDIPEKELPSEVVSYLIGKNKAKNKDNDGREA